MLDGCMTVFVGVPGAWRDALVGVVVMTVVMSVSMGVL